MENQIKKPATQYGVVNKNVYFDLEQQQEIIEQETRSERISRIYNNNFYCIASFGSVLLYFIFIVVAYTTFRLICG